MSDSIKRPQRKPVQAKIVAPYSSHRGMMDVVDSLPGAAPTPSDQAADAELTRKLRELVELVQARNLESAVALAQQAAAGRGPYVDMFCEIGRRFGHSLEDTPPQRREKLRVVEGGAQ